MQKGDIGTIFEEQIKDQDGNALNISDATTKNIIFKSPTGVKKTFTATFVNAGVSGWLKFTTTLVTDIDESKEWDLQFHVIGPGYDRKSMPRTFTVLDNL